MAVHRAKVEKEDCLSTGSTLINLACSGYPDYGLTKGRYFWMSGDSTSGKTFLCLTIFAEAANNRYWDNYDLVFDDVEGGALMDMEKFFGAKMAARLQPPAVADGLPVYSATAEDFYFGLDDRLSLVEAGKGKPFLYLLDSMDALSSIYEAAKFDEKKKARRGGAKAKGDYGDGKAKINSSWIRTIVRRLRDTKSTLIILSQTRDNMDGGMFDPKSITAGGRALKFYATWQLQSSVGAKIKKTVNGKDRIVGVQSRIQIQKNRLTGRARTTEVPIYYSYGIDDVGSMVDFMTEEKAWKMTSGKIAAPDLGLDVSLSRDKLIKHIEEKRLQFDLQNEVYDAWKAIEEKCELPREGRYE